MRNTRHFPTDQEPRPPRGESSRILESVYAYAAHLGIVSSMQELKDQLTAMRQSSDRGLVRSDISWTDFGWACIVGCTVYSSGCSFCYAELLHNRRHEIYQRNGGLWRPDGERMAHQYALPFGTVQILQDRLGLPLRTSKAGRVFVNAAADVFHAEVPLDFIQKMFLVMGACPAPEIPDLDQAAAEVGGTLRQAPLVPQHPHGRHGRKRETRYRADLLRQVPATVRWISAEPLLSSLRRVWTLPASTWVVVGGETGAKKQRIRPAHPDWFRDLRDRSQQLGIAYFSSRPATGFMRASLKAPACRRKRRAARFSIGRTALGRTASGA